MRQCKEVYCHEIKMLRKGKTTEEIQEWVDLSTQRIEQLASSIKWN